MQLYDFKVTNNKGKEVALQDYKGKVLLIVNTATQCGLTPQYQGLEELYEKYKDKGFEILDFPSNQFLSQAPGSDAEIEEFCTLNYKTTFPRFHKIDVNGQFEEPLYKWLKKKQPVAKGGSMVDIYKENMKKDPIPGDVIWNFEKFLVNKDGEVVERFTPLTTPQELEEAIETIL